MRKLIFSFCALCSAMTGMAQSNYKSEVWSPDNGDGTYTNPVINADYSDPDVCRVGVDYYMTSSSFCAFPGLQILHSTDLVNWVLVGAALRDYSGPNWSDQRPWEVTGHGMRGDTSRVPGALEWRTVPQHGKGMGPGDTISRWPVLHLLRRS